MILVRIMSHFFINVLKTVVYVTYKCSVLTSKKTQSTSIEKNRHVMEITSISWENHKRNIIILCGQNSVSSCYSRHYLFMKFFHLTGGGTTHAVSLRYTSRYMQFLHVTPGSIYSFFTLHYAERAVSSRYIRRYVQFLHVTLRGTCSFFTLH